MSTSLLLQKGIFYLTQTGFQIAQNVYERHQVLTDALMKLGVPAETAEEDACRIEHIISDATFTAIKEHLHTKIEFSNHRNVI